MTKARGDTQTLELFDVDRLFPVETPRELERAFDFNLAIATAMREAIRKSGLSNDEVAARMSALLGDDIRITGAQLYAYTAASRQSHNISLVRWKAFVRATGQTWLWNIVLEGEGVTLMMGEEALLAQAMLARKRAQAWTDEAKRLEQAAPLVVGRERA